MNYQSRPLSAITRISPLNPRQDMESDVSSLAATIEACGLIDPLLIWPRPDAIGEYEVLSGGRRWRALRELESRMLDSDHPEYSGDREIKVDIHQGDEASARRAALAAAVTPRPQHPVDEYEAFSLLSQSGFSTEQIARDFGETEKHIKQRLALGELSPVVRDMWRKGEIDREEAQAFTIGSIEAQEAFIAECRKTDDAYKLENAFHIRRALRGDVMDSSSPITKYIHFNRAALDAYLAAGGRFSNDLFADGIELRDGPIARRVAEELLRAEAQRIADAEGWGRAFISDELVYAEEYEPELTDDENARINEIDDLLASRADDRESLESERESIIVAGTLRELSPDQRGERGVLVELNHKGRILVYRGVELPDDDAEEPGGDTPASPPGESGEELDPHDGESDKEKGKATPDPLAEPGKALRAVIDDCATKGLREAIRGRVDLALMFAVAALGCRYDVVGIGLRPVFSHEAHNNELLARIGEMRFDKALVECAAASTADLTVAFAVLIAMSIETQGASFEAVGALCQGARARAADLKGAFERAIDRRAYFDAAPKEHTLKIIGGLIGAGEAKAVKSYKKDKLAEYAATLAKEKGHVPPPLSNWAAFPSLPDAGRDAMRIGEPTPLAEAMADALAADESAKSNEARALEAKIDEVAAIHAAPLFAKFIRERLHFGNDALDAGRVKASDVYDAYRSFKTDRNGGKPLSLSVFGEAMSAIGVEKKRSKTGVHYLNIALRDAKE